MTTDHHGDHIWGVAGFVVGCFGLSQVCNVPFFADWGFRTSAMPSCGVVCGL
jgi:hypothetical protein